MHEAGVLWSTTPVAASPCWADHGTARVPALTEDTCVRQDTAAERPAAAPTTTNSGVSSFIKAQCNVAVT